MCIKDFDAEIFFIVFANLKHFELYCGGCGCLTKEGVPLCLADGHAPGWRPTVEVSGCILRGFEVLFVFVFFQVLRRVMDSDRGRIGIFTTSLCVAYMV